MSTVIQLTVVLNQFKYNGCRRVVCISKTSVLFLFVTRPTFGFAFLVSCITIKENRPVSLSNSSASVTTSV